MSRKPLAAAARRLPAIAAACLLVAVATGLARGDDRNLLRTTEADPYVFFLLDTSASMNADVDGKPVPAAGDDPRSKIYMAKKSLYGVFSDATEFNYGFAFYQQDGNRVRAKHWLYRLPTVPSAVTWTPTGVPAFDWPTLVDLPTLQDDDGEPEDAGVELSREMAASDPWVFGPVFTGLSSKVDTADFGGCDDPFELSNAEERRAANRFPRAFGTDTVFWIVAGGQRYKVTISKPVVPAAEGEEPVDAVGGEPTIQVDLTLERRPAGNSCNTLETVGTQPVQLQLVTDFLFYEDPDTDSGEVSGGLGTNEVFGGSWDWQDAVVDQPDCPSGSFTGHGWEENYDNESYVDAVTRFPVSRPTGINYWGDSDESCTSSGCQNLHFIPTNVAGTMTPATWVRSEGRNVDRGDILPFDWDDPNLDAFLERLNPNHGSSTAIADYGIASYFTDGASGAGPLSLRNPSVRPLVAAGGDTAVGGSPLARAINDFRCWYAEKGSKCNDPQYTERWEEVARRSIGNDSGCVQPYLILVTDAENTCGGESPVADVANLKSQANVRTWVIAIARRDNKGECGEGQIKGISAPGKGGQLICVENEGELGDALREIRGQIEEEARTFASAAVPTIQATADPKIFVSNFTPAEGESVWPGTVNAFDKPLPLDEDQRPDVTDDRFLWSADEQLRQQIGGLGPAVSQRRVYYTQVERETADPEVGEPVPAGELGLHRKSLEPPIAPTDALAPSTIAERDLWTGLGVPFTPGVPFTESAARTETDAVLDETYAVKSTEIQGETVSYLMGDIFHSDPTVLGAPTNTRYFAANLHGYRDFARIHENRRKVLLVGTNEGMLHAFDAGRAEEDDPDLDDAFPGDVQFTPGTGRELFAYVPRPMLRELRERAQGTSHDWGVDLSLKVVDALVDVVYETEPDPDDREWRTLVIGGYREGGRGYYALDVTQPDPVEELQLGVPARSVFMPLDSVGTVPPCHADSAPGSATDAPEDCHHEVPWPAARWEFLDEIGFEPLDEDLAPLADLDSDDPADHERVGNGEPDLALSWSIPNLGRIRICDGSVCFPSTDPENPDDLVDRHVAVFGGGLPAERSEWGRTGNFLYIVDLETGEAIYKRQLEGSVASEPAAVDTDDDGYLDRIYVGTTAGYMYRIDLEEYEIEEGEEGEEDVRILRPYPNLATQMVPDVDGELHAVQRIPDFDADGVPVWRPRKIFDTLAPAATTTSEEVRRPIFLRPSVLFVAELARYALSFGTGDREDLWRPQTVVVSGEGHVIEGRYYTFVDDSDLLDAAALPMDESLLRTVELTSPHIDVDDPDIAERNFLLHRTAPGTRGWVMRLGAQERLISDPFGLSGVTFFVTYTPRRGTESGQCTRTGDSHIFAVNTTNANGFLRDHDQSRTRFISHQAFATEPFTEPGQSKNPVTDVEGTFDDLELGIFLQEVMDELKTLFPASCKFGNYRIDVKTVLSDTRVSFIAPVPVCIIEKNWKEFDR